MSQRRSLGDVPHAYSRIVRLGLELAAVLALVAAGVLLLFPVTKTESVWAVTVGTSSAGFVPVGTESTPLIQAAFSNRGLLGSSDRLRLAAAFALVGMSGGIGLTLVLRRRA